VTTVAAADFLDFFDAERSRDSGVERAVAGYGLVALLACSLGRVDRQIPGIDFDGGAAIVTGMRYPAALADHRERKGLTAPQLREHRRSAFWIIGCD
jgi:hypothetical protein